MMFDQSTQEGLLSPSAQFLYLRNMAIHPAIAIRIVNNPATGKNTPTPYVAVIDTSAFSKK